MPEGPKPTDLSPSTIRQGDCSSDVTTSPRTTSILEQRASLREPSLVLRWRRCAVRSWSRGATGRGAREPRRPLASEGQRTSRAAAPHPLEWSARSRTTSATELIAHASTNRFSAKAPKPTSATTLTRSSCAWAGSRGPAGEVRMSRFPGPSQPRVVSRGRPFLTRCCLVMKGSPVRVRASASYQRGDGSPARQRLASRSGVLDDADEVSLGGPIERPGRPGSRPADTSRRRRDSRLGASRRAPRRDPPSL
jgi:hypothetical protein